MARRLRDGREERVPAPELEKGDLVVCRVGDIIPADGDVVEGIASIDESAVTGESAPVIRESGGDRSAVTGGTRVISDRITIRVTMKSYGFLDRMIALVEGARRQKTPNEIALLILLAALTLIFLLVCFTLRPFGFYAGVLFPVPVLVALLVCLIPTTIGGLLSAIGIAGMDRMIQANVIAMSGRAVEAAGDVDVLLLDKTGTITLGNRQASAFIPAEGRDQATWPMPPSSPRWPMRLLKDAASWCWPRSNTIRGREIFMRWERLYALHRATRMSGIDLYGRQIRKGAAEAIESYVIEQVAVSPMPCVRPSRRSRSKAARRWLWRRAPLVLGVIHLKDLSKAASRNASPSCGGWASKRS